MIDEIPHTPAPAPAEIPHAPLPPADTAAPGWRQETTQIGGGVSGLGVYTHDAIPGKRFLAAPEGFVEQRLPGDTTPPLTIPRSHAEIDYTLRRGVEDLTREYLNSISVEAPKSQGGDVGIAAMGVKSPFARVKSPVAQEFIRQTLESPLERQPDVRKLSIGEKAEVHKALYDTLHDYQAARTNYHIETATADEYAPAQQALYEQAQKYAQANPLGNAGAFAGAVHEGATGFARNVAGLANPNQGEQLRINQAQRYLTMARTQEHPLAVGSGMALGNAVAPESIAAMLATAGVVNPIEEGLAAEGTQLALRAGLGANAAEKVGAVGAKLATAIPKAGGMMTAPQTAEQIAAGEKVTPEGVARNLATAVPAVLAGEAGGALTERASAGVPASLRAPVRLAGAGGSGAAANIAAGIVSQGRIPTAEEAVEQGISGAVVGGVTGLPGVRGGGGEAGRGHPQEIPHETPQRAAPGTPTETPPPTPPAAAKEKVTAKSLLVNLVASLKAIHPQLTSGNGDATGVALGTTKVMGNDAPSVHLYVNEEQITNRLDGIADRLRKENPAITDAEVTRHQQAWEKAVIEEESIHLQQHLDGLGDRAESLWESLPKKVRQAVSILYDEEGSFGSPNSEKKTPTQLYFEYDRIRRQLKTTGTFSEELGKNGKTAFTERVRAELAKEANSGSVGASEAPPAAKPGGESPTQAVEGQGQPNENQKQMAGMDFKEQDRQAQIEARSRLPLTPERTQQILDESDAAIAKTDRMAKGSTEPLAPQQGKVPEEIPHEQPAKVPTGDNANGAIAPAKEEQPEAVKYSRASFAHDLKAKFGLPPDQSAAVLAIADARARTWAREQGKTAEEYYPSRIAGVTNEGVGKNATPDNPLLQSSFENASAMVSFQKDGKALIRALKSPTVASAVHELGHIFRRDLSPQDLKASEEWAGDDPDFPMENGRWTRFHEERFARGFELYLREGKAPTTAMGRVFAKFKEWLSAIYKSVIPSSADGGFEFGDGHALNVYMSDEMRATFDRMLGKEHPEEIPHEAPKGESDALGKQSTKSVGSQQGGDQGAGQEGGGGVRRGDAALGEAAPPGKAQGEGGAATAEVDAPVKAMSAETAAAQKRMQKVLKPETITPKSETKVPPAETGRGETLAPESETPKLSAKRAKIEDQRARVAKLETNSETLAAEVEKAMKGPPGPQRTKIIEQQERAEELAQVHRDRLERMMDDYFAAGGKEPDHASADEAPKPAPFANTKAALDAAVKDLTMPGNTTLGSGFGNLSKAFEHAVNISVALIKDLSAAGKHGFEAFVKAISEHVSDARLRNLMIHGERDPETKKMVGGARSLYNSAREHPDIVAHGHQNTMTPAEDLPNALRVAELARRTPEQLSIHEEQRAASAALPAKPPTETQILRDATIKPEETTKGTIFRTTGARSVEEPTITASKALGEKLNTEAALTGKAWMGEDARARITASAKELPRDLRGEFLHAISTAKNQGDVDRATARMENNLATHQLREAYVAGANLMAQHRLANLPWEFTTKARAEAERLKAILDNVRELPNRPRPKGEPAASPAAMDAYRAQIDESVKKINEHIEAGKQFMRDQIARPGSVPPETSKPVAPGLKRTTADILHEVLSPTEQYSYLRRNYNPDVQATAQHLLQARKETVGTYNDFLAKALPKKHADAMRVLGDLVRLGWHNRVNDMRSRAFQSALDAGLDHEAAVAASERVGTGIPDTGAANAAKIKADPLVRKAALYWLDTIAPAQDANLARSGQSIAGWASKARELADPLDGMMINLPPEKPADAEHFGVRRRGYDQAEALLDETTGNAEYLKDFPRVAQNNIAYPIRARTNAEFAKAVERGGFMFAPDSPAVRQASDGRVYVKANGVERLAKAVLVDDETGTPQPRFVPRELADIPQYAVPELKGIPKLAGKMINAYVTARLAAGADVGYHVWREFGNTGAILAREGTAATLAPWVGGRALAAERAYRAMTLPHGDMLKLLANRLGFDRGTGYYATEHEPTTKFQKVIQFGHQILFHPQYGVDTNIRSVVAESYLRAKMGAERYEQITEAVNSGKLTKAAGADALMDAMGGRGQIELTNFVNKTLGVNNRTLRAEYLNKLSFVMPFIGQHVGPLPSEIGRFATGNIPFSSVLEHGRKGNPLRASAAVVGGLMSGAVGAYLAANLLNYAASSGDKDGPKWLWDNAPGHRTTPLVVPGVYWTNLSPGDSRPARITGVQTALNDKSAGAGVGDVPRNVTNELIGTIPLLDPVLQMSGHSGYFTRHNMLAPSAPEDLNPISVGAETAKAGLQHLRGKDGAEPMGQAMAKDAATMIGERIAFQDPKREAEARKEEERADLAPALRKSPKDPELLERLRKLPDAERTTIQKRATFKDDDAYKLLATGKLDDMVSKLETMGADKLRGPAYSQPNALTKKYESYWDVANRRLYQANGEAGKLSDLKARMSALRAQ